MVNLLGPIYFDICHATESRFALLEFVRMSDVVHHDAGTWLSKCQIEFRRKPERSTFMLVCIYYIYISVCVFAGNCGCVSFHFWVCLQSCKMQLWTFLISNFLCVLYVVCFLLGNSLASEFICRRFGTLCLFHLHRQIGMKDGLGLKMLEYLYGKRFG